MLREKAVDVEMLVFSGLEAQGDMDRLLDEIYGEPVSPPQVKQHDALEPQRPTGVTKVSDRARPPGSRLESTGQ